MDELIGLFPVPCAVFTYKNDIKEETKFIENLQYESKSTIINILGTMENLHNENEKLTAEIKTILKFIKIHKKYKKKSNCTLLWNNYQFYQLCLREHKS